MASVRDAAREGIAEPDSGVRILNRLLREKNLTDDTSPYVSRAIQRLDLVRPKIEEAKAFIASTNKRGDLDERTRQAELAGAELAVSLFAALVHIYEKASTGSESAPLKMVSVAANTLGAYLKKGPVLQASIYSVADPQVMEAQISSRMSTARELHYNVRMALDGVDEQFGVSLPLAPL